jgi:ABC-type transport system involved in multi-copper enzyme maturation permease subunit
MLPAVPKSPWLPLTYLYVRKHIRRKIIIIVAILGNIPFIVAAVMLYLIGQGKAFGGPVSNALPSITLSLSRPFYDIFLAATAVLAALVAAPAVAGERKLGAPLFHVIRPMSSAHYFVGHWLAVTAVLLATSAVPMTGLFIFAQLVIPKELLEGLPWIDVIRVVASGIFTAGLIGMAAVAFSTLSGSTRGATMIWLLAYFGSDIVAEILSSSPLRIEPAACASLPAALKQIAALLMEGRMRFTGCDYTWIGFPLFVVAMAALVLRRGVRAIERD